MSAGAAAGVAGSASSATSSVAAAVAAPASCYAHSNHWVGYHASAAGAMANAAHFAQAAHARAFAFFTRSQRKWESPPMEEEEAAGFRDACATHGFPPEAILPHGSYLTNAGAPAGSELRAKTIAALVDECKRVAALGLTLYNFHPGSSTACGKDTAAACANVASAINEVHAAVPGVVLVIETMAGQGGQVGSTFEEVAAIISGVADKTRVGVCIDTAHIHGAGYDVTTPERYDAMMQAFDRLVGLQYLRGMHLNDSAVECGKRVDRHWHIGRGRIGIEAFRAIMNDKRTEQLPLILETPAGGDALTWLPKYRNEVALLYALEGTKPGEPIDASRVYSSAAAASLNNRHIDEQLALKAAARKAAKDAKAAVGGSKRKRGAAGSDDDGNDEEGEDGGDGEGEDEDGGEKTDDGDDAGGEAGESGGSASAAASSSSSAGDAKPKRLSQKERLAAITATLSTPPHHGFGLPMERVAWMMTPAGRARPKKKKAAAAGAATDEAEGDGDGSSSAAAAAPKAKRRKTKGSAGGDDASAAAAGAGTAADSVDATAGGGGGGAAGEAASKGRGKPRAPRKSNVAE